jgi:hypothetical protein
MIRAVQGLKKSSKGYIQKIRPIRKDLDAAVSSQNIIQISGQSRITLLNKYPNSIKWYACKKRDPRLKLETFRLTVGGENTVTFRSSVQFKFSFFFVH